MNIIGCVHEFIYGGVKYRDDYSNRLSGTGAVRRIYYDWFYCKKCLEPMFKKLDYEATSYDDIKFSATPVEKI